MAKKIRIEDYDEPNIVEKEDNKSYSTSKNNSDNVKSILIIINITLIISIILIIVFYNNKITKLKDENKDLSEEKDLFKNESERIFNDVFNVLGDEYSLDYIKEKLDFYDNSIVFQIEGFGNYYYTYDCMMKKVNGSYSYWAYNKEAAIDNGLRQGTC